MSRTASSTRRSLAGSSIDLKGTLQNYQRASAHGGGVPSGSRAGIRSLTCVGVAPMLEASQRGPRLLGVFLLDDHEVVRAGLRALIESSDDLAVVGEAATVADAMAAIPLAKPDVAMLDVRLPDGSGMEVCRDVRSAWPRIVCIMLTSYADDEALFAP